MSPWPGCWRFDRRCRELVAWRCAMGVDRVARTLDTFDLENKHKNWIYVLLNESEQRVRGELDNAQPSHVSLQQS